MTNEDFLVEMSNVIFENGDNWCIDFEWTTRNGMYFLVIVHSDGETSVETSILTEDELTSYVKNVTEGVCPGNSVEIDHEMVGEVMGLNEDKVNGETFQEWGKRVRETMNTPEFKAETERLFPKR